MHSYEVIDIERETSSYGNVWSGDSNSKVAIDNYGKTRGQLDEQPGSLKRHTKVDLCDEVCGAWERGHRGYDEVASRDVGPLLWDRGCDDEAGSSDKSDENFGEHCNDSKRCLKN